MSLLRSRVKGSSPPAAASICQEGIDDEEDILPAAVCLTEEELQVARILCRLPETILYFDLRLRRITSPSLPDYLRWGTRRRRSISDDPPPPLPPSPAPPPPPPGEEKEEGDGCEVPTSSSAFAVEATTSSPATPLSFPGSGGEDDDGRPSSAAPSPPPKQRFKNPKRHKEWVEEQRQKIATLTDDKAYLKRVIDEYRSRIEMLRANNSVLREIDHRQAKAAAVDYSRTPNHHQNHRVIPDLNALPEEAVEEEGPAVAAAAAATSGWQDQKQQQQRSVDYKVASMEARKRRREIQREKRSCSPWMHASKALRLR
ncbi:unnamed protein product [Musa acuminata subsp. malaccensis]|uniref:(wild Malaysian banana) hypothetical protein n=1 Tax=Musa acuminata subsp. malaccensis TaxID=214687 RepID=A0A804IB97_MUSAM|nr:unnamed protein product [Musa acuminata subsp. malaccensis]